MRVLPRQQPQTVTVRRPIDNDRRRDRHDTRRLLWSWSSLKRVRGCGRWRIAGAEDVGLSIAPGSARYRGLQSCGSIWACPVCSAKIRAGRADEISSGVGRWIASGGSVLLVTFTVRHGKWDRLADLLDAVSNGFRHVLSGREWQQTRESFGVAGTIAAREITHGGNGWHPHLHALVLLEPALFHDVDGLRDYFTDRWLSWLRSQGLDGLPGIAVDVRECSSADVGAYVAKVQDPARVGNELARLDMKKGRLSGRTPFEALRDATTSGDMADLVLWWEYERSTKGRQCITWSKGLKGRLLVDERTDAEILDDVDQGEVLVWLPPDVWASLVSERHGPVGLLEAAEAGGADAATAYLQVRGLRWTVPRGDPPP